MKIKAGKKILMLTYGDWDHASSRIRAAAYIPLLEKGGNWKVHWLPRAPKRKSGLFYKVAFAFIKRMFTVRRYSELIFRRWDVIFVQRQFLSNFLLKIIKRRNIPMIFDFDDAIYIGSDENVQSTNQMIFSAKSIVVSSPELAMFCTNLDLHAEIIPSPVDSMKITAKNPNKTNQAEVVLGWVGSEWTEKYLKNIEKALIQVSKEHEVKLLVIGASNNFSVKGLSIDVLPWSYNEETKMLHKMDIGLMPLPDDEWSRGKGGYKIYQYMAAGLPVVASPVGINKSIVEHGDTGFLAESSEDWVEYLTLLIKDNELRNKMGEAGRTKLLATYSYEVCFPMLDSILRKALR